MTINSSAIISVTEANQNFSRGARMAETQGMWWFQEQAVQAAADRPGQGTAERHERRREVGRCGGLHPPGAPCCLCGTGEMIRFSKKKVLLLHQIIAGAGGGSAICFGTEPDRCFSRTAGAEGRA